jgi:predicted flap endonuclease-1-like 5' DNA nuclease
MLTWILSRPKIGKRNSYIKELEDSVKSKEKTLKGLNKTLTEHEASLEGLNTKFNKSEKTVINLKEKLLEQNHRAREIIAEQNTHKEELEANIADREKKIKKASDHAKEAIDHAKEQASIIGNLNVELNQRQEIIDDLDIQLQKRNKSILAIKDENSDLNNQTMRMIGERDNQVEKLENILVSSSEKNDRLNELLKEQGTSLDSLQAHLAQRDSIIEGLNFQLHEQNNYINELKEEKADLGEQVQVTIVRAEEAETGVKGLREMLKERESELDGLQERTLRMQDNLTLINGIGKKISSVLIHAGIDTFAKLATTDADEIRKILEKENPSLLRLTNPSTWPEQARIAAASDWEALSNLQNSIKAIKS